MAGRNRLSASELLESAVRRRVLEVVRKRPGCGSGEVARSVGLGHNRASYHLDMLCRRGVLTFRSTPRGRRYFLPGRAPPSGETPGCPEGPIAPSTGPRRAVQA